MAVMLSAALPVLLSVTACAVLLGPTNLLPNVKLGGGTLTTGAGREGPERFRLPGCGLPAAASLMLRLAARAPFFAGFRDPRNLHSPPARRDPDLVLV